jgi:hypothetical protein
MDIKSNNALPFLDAVVNKHDTTLFTKVYRKITATRRYLTFESSHPHAKAGDVHTLLNRAITIREIYLISCTSNVI